MINTKDNIFIEGFDDVVNMFAFMTTLKNPLEVIIMCGKTSEISEELAKECVIKYEH